jgi:hypothetical protein
MLSKMIFMIRQEIEKVVMFAISQLLTSVVGVIKFVIAQKNTRSKIGRLTNLSVKPLSQNHLKERLSHKKYEYAIF